MRQGPDRTGGAAGADTPAAESFEGQILSLLPSMRRYSRSLTRSDSDGEDLLQDCVEKVLVRRAQWRGLNLRAWVLTIMTNLHRNSFRRAPMMDLDEMADMPAMEPQSDPLERTRLQAALDTLSAENRAVLMLVVVEGYSYQEVADMLDIPIGTVMSRLSRARQRMTDLMNADNVIALRRPK